MLMNLAGYKADQQNLHVGKCQKTDRSDSPVRTGTRSWMDRMDDVVAAVVDTGAVHQQAQKTRENEARSSQRAGETITLQSAS